MTEFINQMNKQEEYYKKLREMRKERTLKKCPICGSTKISIKEGVFYCRNCGYLNKSLIRKSLIKENNKKV